MKMMQTHASGLPVKKIKAFKKHIHNNDEAGDRIITTFIEQQEKMLGLITASKDINLSCPKLGISIAPFIQLRLGDILLFIAAHNLRHLKQADRAIAKFGVAAADTIKNRQQDVANGSNPDKQLKIQL